MQRPSPQGRLGIVLGTGTQTQDTVDPAHGGVASLLPPPPPTSAFCGEVFFLYTEAIPSLGPAPVGILTPANNCLAFLGPLNCPPRPPHQSWSSPGSMARGRGTFPFISPLSSTTVGRLVFLFIFSFPLTLG